ncbi:hypothetical protein ACF0H5_020315 [Mactra antiquata]
MSINIWILVVILVMVSSDGSTAVRYDCPRKDGDPNYGKYDPYSDNVRVDYTTSIKFQTKGSHDAHILLQNDRHNYDSRIVEIVIGGWDNSKSAIRNKQQGDSKVESHVRRLETQPDKVVLHMVLDIMGRRCNQSK